MIFVAVASFLSCNPPVGGGGSDIPPGYVGTLYYENGKPAANVVVRIVKYTPPRENLYKKSSLNPNQCRDVFIVTDKNGNIALDSLILEDGYYQIHGESGKLKSFADSICFVDNKCDPVFDTLRETGSVSGRVLLDFGCDPRTVEIYVFGIKTNYYVLDREGNFKLDYLAEGVYSVRFISSLDRFRPLDTTFQIRSGRHDTIGNPIVLPNLVVISNFTYTMDTLMRSVSFYWNRIDESQISGYQLGTMEGEPFEGIRTILKDTSITLYIKDSIRARIRVLDLNNDPLGNFTSPIYIKAVNLVDKKTLFCPIDSTNYITSMDSVRAISWALANNKFYILRSSRFSSKPGYVGDAKIDIISDSGIYISTISPEESANNPLAVSSYKDSLFLLDKKNADSVCILYIGPDDTFSCSRNILFPNSLTSGTNFKFRPDGSIVLNYYMSLFIIDREGNTITLNNGINSRFALTENCLYTNMEGLPWRVIKYSIVNDAFVPVDQIFYDKYKLIINSDPKLFVANNRGIICCLIDYSIFVFDDKKSFKARFYLKDAPSVVDCILTEDDLLYLLYINERIDVVDLKGITSRFD